MLKIEEIYILLQIVTMLWLLLPSEDNCLMVDNNSLLYKGKRNRNNIHILKYKGAQISERLTLKYETIQISQE